MRRGCEDDAKVIGKAERGAALDEPAVFEVDAIVRRFAAMSRETISQVNIIIKSTAIPMSS